MHVLLATFGTRGDVQPMLALALALGARGHTATIAGPPDFAEWAGRLGVTYASVGESIGALLRENVDERGESSQLRGARVIRRWFCSHYAPLTPLVEAADVVFGTGLTSAPLDLAEKFGRRFHLLMFCPGMIPSAEHPSFVFRNQRLPAWVNRLSHRLVQLGVDLGMRPFIDVERKKLGLGRSPKASERLPYQNLVVACEPALGPLPRDLRADRWVLQPGAFLFDDGAPLEARVEAFLNRGAPPVYVGFGSMVDVDARATHAWVLEAARQAGVRVVLLGPAPSEDQVVLTVTSANHQALFPRCAAVVHHGGAGTTMTAARAGVPQVVAPHEVDQFYWAERLARLGVAGPAVKARRRRGPELVAALRAVVEDAGLRERARKLKADLREDGVARMVAALERPLNAADRADDPNRSGRIAS